MVGVSAQVVTTERSDRHIITAITIHYTYTNNKKTQLAILPPLRGMSYKN